MARVDRRALFASGAAAALLAATGLSLAASPRRGGHLRLAVPRATDGLTDQARSALFETLTEMTPDGVLRGRLATDWQASHDSSVWDLTLRRGVMFHDNAPMRAEDVAVSLEDAPVGLPALVGVEILANNRLRLTLTDSDPHLPIRLAAPECVVRPATDTDQSGMIGTGLYSARHVSSGGGLVAMRVGDHYLSDCGWAERVDIVAMSDPAMRAQAFNDGLVDAAVAPEPDALKQATDMRRLPADGAPLVVARSTVGVPTATESADPRMAERFWLV